MTELNHYQDGSGSCYANIRMENGDPVFISIAQSGVIIKKSLFGLFGPKLFVSKDVYEAATTARKLDEMLNDDILPKGFHVNNVVLKSYVKACMKCKTVGEITLLINEAARSVE